MSRKFKITVGVSSPLLVAATVAVAMAAGSSSAAAGKDVVRALDEELEELSIREQEVGEALSSLGHKVGIEIAIENRSADLLPWGAQTKLKAVSVRNASLRDVLPKVLGHLGMTYRVVENALEVVATEPMKRINRRATWEDLKLLNELNNAAYTPQTFAKFKFRYRITSKVDAPGLLKDQMGSAGQGSMAEVLEAATSALGWVWFPNNDHVVIRTEQAQIANRMSRRVTFRYTNRPLAQILLDLANRAETAINFEPGMMKKLPATTAKSTNLVLQQSSIRQAFELLSAETGITYKIKRDGIHVALSDAVASPGNVPPGPKPKAPYVGKISVPLAGGKYTFDILLRQDELPEDILEYRQQMIEQLIQEMRAEMAP